jgi:cobalt/nickel transport system permease protein
MALVSTLVGFCCYRLLCGRGPSPTRRVAALAFASWSATIFAAASCAEQLAQSDTARLSVVLPAMVGVHALVGIGEAVISAMVLSAVLRFRPELLETAESSRPSAGPARSLVLHGLGLSLAVVALLVPVAYDAPDGLSSVAQSLGFQSAERVGLAAPLAQYGVPGLASGVLTTVLAGGLGILLLFGLCWLLALGLVPRTARPSSEPVVAESSG